MAEAGGDQTYQTAAVAASPGAALWGGVIGVVYALLTGLFFVATAIAEPASGDATVTLDPSAAGSVVSKPSFQLAVVVGFLLPILGALTLAFVGHRQRRYVLGESGLTVNHGLVRSEQRTLAYADIESLTFTQTAVQSTYGAGTINVNEGRPNQNQDSESLRVEYVQNAETFYSDLRSRVVEASDADVDAPPLADSTDLDDMSSLSGEQLAAETSSDYMMPHAVTRPVPHYSAFYGGLVTTFLAIFPFFFVFPLVRVLGWAAAGAGLWIPLPLSLLWFLGAFGVGAGVNYWKYDHTQYELYPDHVRRVSPDETTSVELADVDSVAINEWTGSSSQYGGYVASVSLQGPDGDELLLLPYVKEPDSVKQTLDKLLENVA